MASFSYWIQHADFSADDFPAVDADGAVIAFQQHDWGDEEESAISDNNLDQRSAFRNWLRSERWTNPTHMPYWRRKSLFPLPLPETDALVGSDLQEQPGRALEYGTSAEGSARDHQKVPCW